MHTKEIIWGFDIGKGSLGEAVRVGNEFKHVQSLEIAPDFAETKTTAAARRAWRTREAHKARELWLENVFPKRELRFFCGERSALLTARGSLSRKAMCVWSANFRLRAKISVIIQSLCAVNYCSAKNSKVGRSSKL